MSFSHFCQDRCACYSIVLAERLLCCSGLPPASSLFTDSEASSEAEEDKAALYRPAQARSAVLSCGLGCRAAVSANKEPLQQQNGVETKQSPLAIAPCSDNQVWLVLLASILASSACLLCENAEPAMPSEQC